MAKFLLILRDNPADFAKLSAEEMQRAIEKYRAWSSKVASQGKLAGSNKLTDEGGKIMRQQKGQVAVVDGPYTEAKEVVGGYYLLEVADYDEAVRLSRDHPHLAFGSIEIRQIDPMTAAPAK